MRRLRPWLAIAIVGFALAGAIAAPCAVAAESEGAADIEAGREAFRRQCAQCHAVEPGEHKTGPTLAGVVGRRAGSADFSRYRGLLGADFDWTEAALDAYLADPRAFVIAHTGNETTSMTFRVPDAQERRNIIAYLKTLE
jgi:cytochrome c